jgi:hypothetical protein
LSFEENAANFSRYAPKNEYLPLSKPTLVVDRWQIYTVCMECMYCSDTDFRKIPQMEAAIRPKRHAAIT